MNYLVVEIQINESGAVGNFAWAYDNRNAADSKYHSVLSAAATSTIPIHSCSILTENGSLVRNESYTHTTEPVTE